MSISSYRVGASIVGVHIVFFLLLFFLNCSQNIFPHVLFQPAMEDMETLNLHTHSRLSAHEGRGRVPPPSQSTKVKIKAIIHNSERLRSISSLCLLPFKCVKGRVRTFFFFSFCRHRESTSGRSQTVIEVAGRSDCVYLRSALALQKHNPAE